MRPIVRPEEKYGERFSNIHMGRMEDPIPFLVRVDNIVDTLSCSDVFPSKQDVNDKIVEGLISG